MTRTKLCIVAAFTLALGASAAFAESLWVQSESVDLRTGKGAVYPTVGSAKKGQELTVVSRDGKWVQVQVAGVTGWVFQSALSAQKVSGGGSFDLKAGDTAQMGTAAAGRGLNPSADTYVASKNLDKRPLEWLIAFRKSIPPEQWEQFTQEGQVGPAAPSR
jgi:uncharacterized protein YgiM (DUF1202 family)